MSRNGAAYSDITKSLKARYKARYKNGHPAGADPAPDPALSPQCFVQVLCLKFDPSHAAVEFQKMNLLNRLYSPTGRPPQFPDTRMKKAAELSFCGFILILLLKVSRAL
jgi:hypothetical protein